MTASGSCRYYKSAAYLTGKAIFTAMRFIISFFKLFSFVFSIHNYSFKDRVGVKKRRICFCSASRYFCVSARYCFCSSSVHSFQILFSISNIGRIFSSEIFCPFSVKQTMVFRPCPCSRHTIPFFFKFWIAELIV